MGNVPIGTDELDRLWTLENAGDVEQARGLVAEFADRAHETRDRAAFDAAACWATKTAPQLEPEHRRMIVEDWRGLTPAGRQVIAMLADAFARRRVPVTGTAR